ncbi:MAG TPA: allantoinase AllB [Thermoanaerobaculia bacterium]|nr:allantoinase AllB [Thermoanaerobaculia bacterium]
MADAELILRSRRVVTPNGVRPASVHVAGGRIAAIREHGEAPPGAAVHDVGERALLPGAVDTHVHLNDPGRAEWEGFASGTRAAAAGGVTTLVDMPLNCVPATTNVAALRAKLAAAQGEISVDVGFWGGVVPGNESDLEPLWAAGVLGFKCFLAPSGVAEFAAVGEADLRRALPILARLRAPLLAHAELPGPLEAAAAKLAAEPGDPRSYRRYLASRPPAAEVEAVELLSRLCRASGARIHVVHVAARQVVPLLRAARRAGLRLSGETCPHYLTFAAGEIAPGATELKCAPPLRDEEHREALWQALAAGDLSLVASDHSPSPPELKQREAGDFSAAWGGISSLQVALAAVWTGAQRRGYELTELARWCAAAPAELAGLGARKGAIAAGRDADLVVFDDQAAFRVRGAELEHRHALTPYEGRELRGVVEQVFLRGALVYDRGRFPGSASGRILSR